MSIVQALALGVLQGLTEFLPISSSGHLVIFQQLLGLEMGGAALLGFDLALHFGTLLSVVVFFYRDIGLMIAGSLRVLRRPRIQTIRADEGAYLACLVLVGTIPAAVVGVAFADFFRSLFASAMSAGAMLLVTGLILWSTRFVKQSNRELKQLRLADALIVGTAQAFAILPGISRSGSTIAAGLFSRWDPYLAVRYSLLLAIPAILGGMVFELDNLQGWSMTALAPLLTGVLAAALSGFVAIRWLLRVVQRGNLSHFAYYCWAVGAATLLWFGLFRG